MTVTSVQNELAIYKWQIENDKFSKKMLFSYVLNCDDLPDGLIQFPEPITCKTPKNQKSYIFSII